MGFLSLRLFYFSLMTFSGPCITQRIKIQVKNVLSLTVLKLHPMDFITSNNMKYIIYILFLIRSQRLYLETSCFRNISKILKGPLRREFQDHFALLPYKLVFS